jgi:hypothetical protein
MVRALIFFFLKAPCQTTGGGVPVTGDPSPDTGRGSPDTGVMGNVVDSLG